MRGESSRHLTEIRLSKKPEKRLEDKIVLSEFRIQHEINYLRNEPMKVLTKKINRYRRHVLILKGKNPNSES